jgi:hypothetical protein
MTTEPATQRYVVCLTDRGDRMSVIKGKLYRVATPDPRDSPDDLRIIDEEGEDYPYPREWFGEVELSPAVIEALEAA